MDKAIFGDGPWQDEPDRYSFTHDGYSCVLIRNNSGAWCGYVHVHENHPWYKDLDILDERIDVYGGLTYQGKRLVYEDPLDDRYFIGFDCAHYNDLVPAFESIPQRMKDSGMSQLFDHMEELKKKFPLPSVLDRTYKDITFAKNECISMVQQLKKAEDTP